MFKNLTDFSYKRNFLQGVGFYLAYFLLAFFISGIIGSLLGMAFGPDKLRQIAIATGTVIALILCLTLFVMIIRAKKIFPSFGTILLLLATIFFALTGSSLLGLIPVSILSTFEPKEIKKEEKENKELTEK